MKKEKETLLDYSFFKSPSNPIISPFTKLLIVIFAFYSILSFSDDGLINSLSENIISEYKISPSKYSSIKMFISLGKVACSISLIKLIKKISNYYKLYCIISLIIKALILISYYYEYSFFVFLVTRGISSFINLYEFVFFVSWFSEQIKKPLFGLLITFLTIYIGSLFGYFFNYLNYDQAVSEKWRANFLLLGIIYFIFSFLLMLVSSNSFKLKKNVYYPSSRWGNLKNKNIEEENNINNNNSNNSLFNMDALMEIKKKMEILENKYILYDLSLEEKLKTMSVSEFNYFQELKNMIINKKYIFTIISLSIFSLIYSTILFWFNDYIINNLHLKQSNTMLINYAIISFFGPLLGIIINRAVELTTNFKKEAKLFSILINSVILCIISIFIQIKVLLEYSNILFLFYISILFYLFPDMIILHLKYTQYTFRKEDFVLLVFTKNFLGETVGSYIYSIGGMSMVLNFSWSLLGLLCCILYLEFITVEKKINNKKVKENKKIEKYRTTVTSDIQGEELKEIDNRESIISVDDTDDNNDKNANKEHEYNLDDYIKK